MNPVRDKKLEIFADTPKASRISNAMKFYLKTNYPLALDSYEYRYPMPTMHTKYNSRNSKFNARLPKTASVLDLGCGGGGFIKDCIDEGRIAIGLEGTDRYQKTAWRDWSIIPDNLFTCDITKPFIIHRGDEKLYQFDVITAWEVMEHIPEPDLEQLFTNVANHLKTDGMFVISIANKKSINPKYQVDMHRIHEDLNWWLDKISKLGFRRDSQTEANFDNQWVRNERKSYHLVLR